MLEKSPNSPQRLPLISVLTLRLIQVAVFTLLVTAVAIVLSLFMPQINSTFLSVRGELSLRMDPEYCKNITTVTKEISQALANRYFVCRISLSRSSLTELPDSIKDFPRLISLDLSHNRLRDIPRSLTDLKSLKTINLSDNLLASFPDDITRFEFLEYLDLSLNDISQISTKIVLLTHLKTLNLYRNPLLSTEKIRIQNLIPSVKVIF